MKPCYLSRAILLSICLLAGACSFHYEAEYPDLVDESLIHKPQNLSKNQISLQIVESKPMTVTVTSEHDFGPKATHSYEKVFASAVSKQLSALYDVVPATPNVPAVTIDLQGMGSRGSCVTTGMTRCAFSVWFPSNLTVKDSHGKTKTVDIEGFGRGGSADDFWGNLESWNYIAAKRAFANLVNGWVLHIEEYAGFDS